MDQAQIQNKFSKDGFVLFKNLFNLDEIEKLRTDCESLREGSEIGLPTDNFSYPKIRDFILDERILERVKTVLGPKLVYFGESTVSFSSHSPPHFHKDARSDSGDPQDNKYPAVRIGIYLQNHKYHSGGLKVRIGSHKHVHLKRRNFKKLFNPKKDERLKLSSFRVGKSYNLPIEAGDLAIWSLRTDHSPNAVRLKIAPNLSVNPKFESKIPQFMRLPEDRSRIAIFNTFGLDHELHDGYMKQRIGKIDDSHWQQALFNSDETIALCEKQDVSLRFDGIESVKNNYYRKNVRAKA